MSKATRKKFWESGLLWLVNTSLLHPRGLALGYNRKTGKIDVVDFGEYTTFDADLKGVLDRYNRAESEREAKFNDLTDKEQG